MATVYGSFYTYSGAQQRVIVEANYSAVNHAAGTCTVTVAVKVQTIGSNSYNSAGTVELSGNSNTGTTTLRTFSGTITLHTHSWSANLLYTGTRNLSFSGETNTLPGASGTLTIPQRQPLAPEAPTGSSASYVSDTRIDVAWTKPASWSSEAYEWVNAVVQRQSVQSPTWVTVATLAGSASAWSDTTVTANERYRYRVAGSNSSGTGSYSTTGYVSTTPAAPTGVTAAKDGLGNIVVTWADNSRAETSFEVYDNGTSGGDLIGSVAAGVTTYTHVSPSDAVTHTYYVRAAADGPRYSSFSSPSNTVALIAPPAAPDNLSPNGNAADAATATLLTWSHVSVDSSPQSAYEVEYRLVGAGTWTSTTQVTSGTSSYELPQGTFLAGQDVEWRVRTWGDHVDPSPWSAVAAYPVEARPTATIAEPSGAINSSVVEVEWGYYQAAGATQNAYEVRILDDTSGTVYASVNGTGTATSWTSPPSVPNEVDVDVRVRVRSTDGLWSAWDEVTRSVVYVPPLAPALDAEWVDGFGHVRITAAANGDGVAPDTVSIVIARSTDGGNTWTDLGTFGLEANMLDWEAPAGGTYHYRATAVSATPSSASTVVEVTVPSVPNNRVVHISGGPGFALCCRVAFDIDLSGEGGRERTLHRFSGRTHEVEFSSRHVPRTINVAGTILPDAYGDTLAGVRGSSREDLEDLFDMPGPHLYRDSSGRVMYGTVSPLQWTRTPGGKGKVSFSITRTARGTDAQLASLSEFYAPRIAEVAPGVYQVIGADVVEAAPGVYEEVE